MAGSPAADRWRQHRPGRRGLLGPGLLRPGLFRPGLLRSGRLGPGLLLPGLLLPGFGVPPLVVPALVVRWRHRPMVRWSLHGASLVDGRRARQRWATLKRFLSVR